MIKNTSHIIITSGLPGSGKSIAAKMISEKIGVDICVVLRTDVIRKELFSSPKYNEEEAIKLYDELYKRTIKYILDKKIVILDGNFRTENERRKAKSVAESLAVKRTLVHVFASENIIKERLDNRTGDPSDATYDTYIYLKNKAEPILGNHISIDNSGDYDNLENKINIIVGEINNSLL